jgi:CubicO group peptidase (beta-lactamase class C family)
MISCAVRLDVSFTTPLWLLVVSVLSSLGLAACGRLIGLTDVSRADPCSTVTGGCTGGAACKPCIHHDDPKITAILESARSAYPEIPGIAAAFIVGNDVYLSARGVRDTTSNAPLQETDTFALWLDSTSLTAALLAKEVDLGNLSWSMTLSDVFPELFTDPGAPSNVYANVTVAQLATHTAGLRLDTSASHSGTGDALFDYSGTPSVADRRYFFTRDAIQDPPLFSPGTARSISMGHILAASVLEHLVHRSYEDLIREDLFAPLFMTHSKWVPDVLGHRWNGSGTPTPVIYDDLHMRNPELGICQSIEDFARFAYMSLCLPGAPRYYSDTARDVLRAAGKGGEMTPGFGTDADNGSGGVQLWLAGSSGSDLSIIDLRPNRNQAVVLLSNYVEAGGGAAGVTWVANQLYQNSANFPNVTPPSFPFVTSPTYGASQASVQVTSPSGGAGVSGAGYEAAKAFDGNYSTYWAPGPGVTDATLIVDLPAPARVTGAVINEVGPSSVGGSAAVVAFGITHFDLILSDGNTQTVVASDDHIGPNLEIRFPPTPQAISRASLRVQGSSLAISELQLLP